MEDNKGGYGQQQDTTIEIPVHLLSLAPDLFEFVDSSGTKETKISPKQESNQVRSNSEASTDDFSNQASSPKVTTIISVQPSMSNSIKVNRNESHQIIDENLVRQLNGEILSGKEPTIINGHLVSSEREGTNDSNKKEVTITANTTRNWHPTESNGLDIY